MSGFGRVAAEAVVEWWLSGAGSLRFSEPEAEATGLAPQQASERYDPLVSPPEGFVLLGTFRTLSLGSDSRADDGLPPGGDLC